MNSLHNRLLYLFELYLNDKCIDSERQELMQLVSQPGNEEAVKNLIDQKLLNIPGDSGFEKHTLTSLRSRELFSEILTYQPDAASAPVVDFKLKKNKNWIWAAAAIFILFSGISVYMLLSRPAPRTDTVQTLSPVNNDINPPSATNAVITLANGQQIVLDSVNTGTVAMQGNTHLVKLADGRIVYDGAGTGEMQYNTLSVPRGGKLVSITLSDGSKVWLNSESSLTYPVAFAGSERSVEITGEAYFEVARNASMPFKVKKADLCVTVLGTHFNVNTYNDEDDIKVSLLEGAVKVNKGTSTGLLQPGQQAKVSSAIAIENNVNMEEVMAWKNGKFQFGDASSIPSVMKQIARWYDIEVVYTGPVDRRVGGTISRDIPVSQVLKMLKMTGAFDFQIVGKKVIVEQK